MKRVLLLQICVLTVFLPAGLRAHFEEASLGTRAVAMGGMFVPVGDDPSTLFSNVAGLVIIEPPTLYGEFSESPHPRYGEESRVAAIYPLPWFTAGVGWYRRGIEEGGSEDLLIAGVAATLITNTQGSFISMGASAKLGRISYESTCDCPESGTSETEPAIDLGVMFRPLPVVSIAYAISTVKEADFGPPEEVERWERAQRWGIAYFWEERVTLGYEQERSGSRTMHHYGFSVRTSTPLELLAGFSDEKVYGGVRWVGERVRVAASFGPDGDVLIYGSASVELPLGFITGGE